MRTLSLTPWILVLLPLGLAGCASTSGASSKMRTVASVGDKPLPVVTGAPGESVVADRVEPEPIRRPEGRISGRVVDEDGRPVPNVRVRLAAGGAPGGRVVGATTDRTGAFTLKGVRPGSSYTVIAEREDDEGLFTGRSEVEAPDIDVRISLAPAAVEPAPASARGARSGVRPASGREDAEFEDEDDGRVPRRRTSGAARVNPEDLPPAAEAEALGAARPTRTTATLPREPSSRAARWRRGAGDPEAGTSASRPPAHPDSDELPPPRRVPEDVEARPARLGPEADELEDEGENPLPPALEPGQASAPPRRRSDTGRSRAGERELARSKGLASGALSAFEPGPEEGPSARRPELARKEAVRPMPSADLFEEDDEPVPTAQVASAVGSRAVKPSSVDPSIFETVDAGPAPGPAPAGLPPADGRKRPTWKDLEVIAAATPTPAATAPETVAPAVASAVVDHLAKMEALAPPPAVPNPALEGRPRAAPRPADDGQAFCNFDAKQRRIVDFRLPDLEGRPVRFQDLDADLVLIDFWGTWCQPCLKSVPHLVELQKRLGAAKLKVVGVACEQGPPAERATTVAKEVQRLGINYPVLLSGMDGPCPVQQALQVQAYPTLILADRRGRILWQGQGATPVTLARLDRFIASATKSDGTRRF